MADAFVPPSFRMTGREQKAPDALTFPAHGVICEEPQWGRNPPADHRDRWRLTEEPERTEGEGLQPRTVRNPHSGFSYDLNPATVGSRIVPAVGGQPLNKTAVFAMDFG